MAQALQAAKPVVDGGQDAGAVLGADCLSVVSVGSHVILLVRDEHLSYWYLLISDEKKTTGTFPIAQAP